MWMTIAQETYKGYRLRVDEDIRRQTVADGSIDAGSDIAVDRRGFIDDVQQPDAERFSGSAKDVLTELKARIDQGTFSSGPPLPPRLR